MYLNGDRNDLEELGASTNRTRRQSVEVTFGLLKDGSIMRLDLEIRLVLS